MRKPSTFACRCRAAEPSPSKRRSARSFRRAARCSCRTTAATASASCASSVIWAARPSCWPHGEQEPADPARIDAALAADPAITHVAQVHCETGTGILNPLPQIAAVVAKHGRGLIVDAMSSYGAIPIDARTVRFDALDRGVRQMSRGRARHGLRHRPADGAGALRPATALRSPWTCSTSGNTCRRQGSGVSRRPPTSSRRCAPPSTSTRRRGDSTARLARYTENCAALVSGMRALGFRTFLPDALQAPIIVTFHSPPDPAYEFGEFYRRVRERGFILYPGKLTAVDTFRVGCIGAIGRRHATAGSRRRRRGPARDGSPPAGERVRR